MKRKKTTSIVLIVTMVLEILFVCACFIFPERVPSQLVMYWHIGFIAELMTCGGIKVTKVIHGYDRDDDDLSDDEEAVG